MDIFDSDYFQMVRRQWKPLLRMDKTNKLASKIKIHSYYGKFAFAQLTYLDLQFDNIEDLAFRIDAERMNYDSTYAKDMATLLSILTTNRIPCTNWENYNRLFSIYSQNWKSRFLISLFCEACSRKGFTGRPLYSSELWGYYKNGYYHNGFLDIINDKGGDIAFDWMHHQMIRKIKNKKLRRSMEKDYDGLTNSHIYPFLVFGSHGLDSYNMFQNQGGMNGFLGNEVPRESREEIYIMVICCFSSVFYFSKEHYDDIFSIIANSKIMGVIHFGADTSFRISPLFPFLQSEIGHIISDAITGKQGTGIFDETVDRLVMETFGINSKFLESSEKDLDFSNIWQKAPDDMIECVDKDFQVHPLSRSKGKSYTGPENLKKIRSIGALNIYEKLLGPGAEERDIFLDIAISYHRLNQFDDCEKALTKVIEIDPNCIEARLAKGSLYLKLNRLLEAEKQFQQAKQIDPDNFEANNYLGYLFMKSNRYNEAEKMLLNAVRIKPDYALSHFYLGLVFYETGRIKQALIEYQSAERINRDEGKKDIADSLKKEINTLSKKLYSGETKINLNRRKIFDKNGRPICSVCGMEVISGSQVCKWCKSPCH